MIDYIKMQINIIKTVNKERKKMKVPKGVWQWDGDFLLITADGYRGYRFWKNDVVINPGTLLMRGASETLNQVFDDSQAGPIVKTDRLEVIKFKQKKTRCRVFEFEDTGKVAKCDERYVTEWGDDVTFKKNPNVYHSPVFVYDQHEVLIGLIMPVGNGR